MDESNTGIKVTALASYPIYPARMGGQKGIALFYKSFSRKCDVTLVSTSNNAKPDDFSGTFLPILSSSVLRYINPFLFFTLKKIIRKNKSSHLILEHPYCGWLGFLLKKYLGIKLVIHSHNIESMRFKSTGKWWWKIMFAYEKWTHQQANTSFFISDEDKSFAINKYKLSADKCFTITYGFDLSKPPSASEKEQAKNIICTQHQIPISSRILLFNGTLDYAPNLHALMHILNDINPILLKSGIDYTIIICGKNLPLHLNYLSNYKQQHIVYAGFVDDISVYFKGADIFINPVTDGGGIKTKLVEALGYNLSCVSTVSGAIGVPLSVTNSKMKVVADDDKESFAQEIISGFKGHEQIDQSFYDYFQWDNIAERAVKKLLS